MAKSLHKWDVSPKEATKIQRELAEKVRLEPFGQVPAIIAGADISFNKFSDEIFAGFVLIDTQSLEVIGGSIVRDQATFPYIPGYLSFREIPPLMKAWEKLPVKPEVVVMDGQGIAHPRRLGLAAHFGVIAGVPAIGCAKTRFIGEFEPPAEGRGSWAPLMDKSEIIGAVLRTKNKVNPVFASPGHLVNLEDSIRILLACDKGYRIPEPTRQAHIHVNEARSGQREPGYWLNS